MAPLGEGGSTYAYIHMYVYMNMYKMETEYVSRISLEATTRNW